MVQFICPGDNTLKVWDISAPPHAQQTIRAHNGEVLTCDWARYDPVSTFHIPTCHKLYNESNRHRTCGEHGVHLMCYSEPTYHY